MSKPVVQGLSGFGSNALVSAKPVLWCAAAFALLCPHSKAAEVTPLQKISWKLEHTFPHDSQAFTQGLEIWGNRFFLETTGIYGKSEVRKIERSTGKVTHMRALDPRYFGEGATRIGTDIIQLTWREGVILKWKFSDHGGFQAAGTHPWSGDGWGITQGNGSLWISNGTSQLAEVDKKTFAVIKTLQVTMLGKPTDHLNELEFINGKIFANVWMTSTIVRINPKSGIIDGLMDISALNPKGMSQDAVANGIAWDGAKKRMYVTGKLWPNIFELSL